MCSLANFFFDQVLIHHPGFTTVSIFIDLEYFLVFVLILGGSLQLSLCQKQGRPAPGSLFTCLLGSEHLLTRPARGVQKKGTSRKITKDKWKTNVKGGWTPTPRLGEEFNQRRSDEQRWRKPVGHYLSQQSWRQKEIKGRASGGGHTHWSWETKGDSPRKEDTDTWKETKQDKIPRLCLALGRWDGDFGSWYVSACVCGPNYMSLFAVTCVYLFLLASWFFSYGYARQWCNVLCSRILYFCRSVNMFTNNICRYQAKLRTRKKRPPLKKTFEVTECFGAGHRCRVPGRCSCVRFPQARWRRDEVHRPRSARQGHERAIFFFNLRAFDIFWSV